MSPEPRTTTADGTTSGAGDVIHNIGYRTYHGPRLGRAYARRSLFTQSLRGAYGLGRTAKAKVLPMILLAAMCLPALILVAVAVATGADDLPVAYTQYPVFLQPVIGIFVAAAAPQAVSLDLRFKTVPLYFSRPIRRADYVSAKYAALTAALFAFVAAPVVILYIGGLLGEFGVADQTASLAKGLLLAALFATVYAGIGLALAALTPRRGFGIATVIAVLTIPYVLVSSLQGIAYYEDSAAVVSWLGLASPGTLMDGFQSAFLGGPSGFPGNVEPSIGEGVCYLAVIAGLLAATYTLLLRRYRKAGL